MSPYKSNSEVEQPSWVMVTTIESLYRARSWQELKPSPILNKRPVMAPIAELGFAPVSLEHGLEVVVAWVASGKENGVYR